MDIGERLISNVVEFVQAALEVMIEHPYRDVWWRGHARSTWGLVPKVMRNVERQRPNYEPNALGAFMRHASTRHQNCPPHGDAVSWLFLAQHYGLPTRLLDWTEVPLIALFFAVAEPEHDEADGVVWALNPGRLNTTFPEGGDGMLTAFHPVVLNRIHNIWTVGNPERDEVAALNTHEVDLRMLLQASGFTLHGSRKALEDSQYCECLCRRLVISRQSKARIRTELGRLGVRRKNVFPDLGNLAKEIADEINR